MSFLSKLFKNMSLPKPPGFEGNKERNQDQEIDQELKKELKNLDDDLENLDLKTKNIIDEYVKKIDYEKYLEEARKSYLESKSIKEIQESMKIVHSSNKQDKSARPNPKRPQPWKTNPAGKASISYEGVYAKEIAEGIKIKFPDSDSIPYEATPRRKVIKCDICDIEIDLNNSRHYNYSVLVENIIKENKEKNIKGKLTDPEDATVEILKKKLNEFNNIGLPDLPKSSYKYPAHEEGYCEDDDSDEEESAPRPSRIRNSRGPSISNWNKNNQNEEDFKFKITHQNCCTECMNKLPKCEGCGGVHENDKEFKLNHCYQCLTEGFRKYIRPYQDKVESYVKSGITERKPQFKYHGEESKAAFGDNDIRSYVVTSNGVSLKLFGIELEYEMKHNQGLGVITLAKLIKETGLKAGIKRDGTLVKGVEIVSAPCDKSYHYEVWRSFFDKIEFDDNIFCAPFEPPKEGQERGTGCGCHVHISKDALACGETYDKAAGNSGYALAALKLMTLVYSPENRKFIELIAGRKSNQFNNWMTHKGLRFDKSNRITGGTSDLTQSKLDHRTAINFHSSNDKTIEFRIFRSTKNHDELMKNIDFVDAACAYCHTGVASMIDMKDWIYFYEFVCKNRQDYQYLYKFLNESREFHELYNNKVK